MIFQETTLYQLNNCNFYAWNGFHKVCHIYYPFCQGILKSYAISLWRIGVDYFSPRRNIPLRTLFCYISFDWVLWGCVDFWNYWLLLVHLKDSSSFTQSRSFSLMRDTLPSVSSKLFSINYLIKNKFRSNYYIFIWIRDLMLTKIYAVLMHRVRSFI